ncbi:MAG: hypothetical protein V3V00_07805 [Saprospiraceae bacterium]
MTKVIFVEGNLLDGVSAKRIEEVAEEMNRRPNVKVRIILNEMGLVFPYMARTMSMSLKELLEIRRVGRVR